MKHRTGMLLKKGAGYYCRWVVSGKVFVRALRDDDGQTITKRDAAEAARVKLMAGYRVAEEVEALQSVAAQLEGKRSELAKIDEERNPPLIIRQFWSTYTAAQNRRDSGPRTLADYAGYWNRFQRWMEKAHPAAVAMRDVTEDMAEGYAADMVQAGLSVGSFNKHRDFLKLGYDVLAKKARTTVNPWNGILRKKPSSVSRRELTVEELRRVCESATGEMRLLFALGLYTGLRLGDCATLRWGEVDIVRRIIVRVPNKTARSNSKPVNVPLHPALRAMLAAIPPEDRRDYVLPNTAAIYRRNAPELSGKIQAHFQSNGVRTTKPGTGVEMITGPDGKPAEKHTGKRAVVEVGFHSLRHSFVSLCRAAGAPLSVVEAIVGHSSPAMTRHYTHTGEAAALAAVTLLPVVVGDAPKALPAPDPLAAFKDKVRTLAEKLTAKTWKEARAELLALAE